MRPRYRGPPPPEAGVLRAPRPPFAPPMARHEMLHTNVPLTAATSRRGGGHYHESASLGARHDLYGIGGHEGELDDEDRPLHTAESTYQGSKRGRATSTNREEQYRSGEAEGRTAPPTKKAKKETTRPQAKGRTPNFDWGNVVVNRKIVSALREAREKEIRLSCPVSSQPNDAHSSLGIACTAHLTRTLPFLYPYPTCHLL